MKLIAGFTVALALVLILAALTQQPAPTTAISPTYPPGREPMALPENYRDTLIHYATIERSDAMSRNLYISPAAIAALKNGEPLPDYTVIVIEAFFVELGDEGRPVEDENGRYIQHSLDPKIHMAEKRSTWLIEDLHATSQLGGWNFGSFEFETGRIADEPLSDCFSCHDGLVRDDFLFSLPELQAFVQTGEVQYSYCPRPGRIRCR